LKFDSTGEPAYDERGRLVYRTRKHDIEEFAVIVERYGCYKRDLEQFAAALRRSGPPKFQGCAQCDEGDPGWRTVNDAGTARRKRCECYTEWQQVRAEMAS
jgi:hypothetical protein